MYRLKRKKLRKRKLSRRMLNLLMTSRMKRQHKMEARPQQTLLSPHLLKKRLREMAVARGAVHALEDAAGG